MSVNYFFSLFFFSLILVSCDESIKEQVATGNTWNDSTSVGFNKDRLKEEELQINLFLSHHSEIQAQTTGTGLRYQIVKKSNGIKVQSGDSVEVSLKISLLNGSICYQTDSSDVDLFLVDKSSIESGIQEGIKFMKEGEKAIFILPSNLAHGLLGDFEKIPPMSPIKVDIELIKVTKNNKINE